MNRSTLTIFFLFFGLIFGSFFLWSKYQSFTTLKENLKQKEIQLNEKEKSFSNLESINQKLKKFEEPLLKIETALPKEPSLPSLFDFISNAATKQGLLVKKIDFLASNFSQEFPEIRESQILIEVTGPYQFFKNFLVALEESARLIGIEEISFSTPEREAPFEFKFRIKVYSY